MCAQIPTASEAVFVGKVTEVWPPVETVVAEVQRLPLVNLREVILQRWHGTLTAEEERYIRTGTDRDAIGLLGILQRIRFVVSETLAGSPVREVYTDATSCGYRFEPGSVYLVNASLDGLRYTTGACSRTSRVESDSAVEDLKALRAWRAGNPLPPRIYGRVIPNDLRSDTRVRLIDDQEARLARLDADGRFTLDGLKKTKYRLQVEDTRGKGERDIDLARISCFEATPWFSDGWHIAGEPTILEPPPPLAPRKQ